MSFLKKICLCFILFLMFVLSVWKVSNVKGPVIQDAYDAKSIVGLCMNGNFAQASIQINDLPVSKRARVFYQVLVKSQDVAYKLLGASSDESIRIIMQGVTQNFKEGNFTYTQAEGALTLLSNFVSDLPALKGVRFSEDLSQCIASLKKAG